MSEHLGQKREHRAKVIHAEGELRASESLAGAAKKISTILFPVPVDLIKPFIKAETDTDR